VARRSTRRRRRTPASGWTYRSTAVKLSGDDVITSGDLTVGATTHPVEVNWEFGGVAKDPYGATKAGFEGTAIVNRKDFGLEWNAPLETGGFLISEKVKLVLDIEVGKQD
jgi:polyisoprenoid-binding protein YceI